MLLHDNYILFFVNVKAVVKFRSKVKCTNFILYVKCISAMAESDKTLKEDGNLSNNNRNNSAPSIVPISSGTVISDTHPTHHAAVSEPSTLKRKQTSFQITSVTVKGSRLSTDGGEDSADDLDESHTEDASSDILECSRTTDVDNDQLSEDNSNTTNNDEVLTNAPSIAVKCKVDMSVKEITQTAAALKVPLETSKNEDPNMVSENTQSDYVKPPALPDQWQHRFRVVKIVSSEPFKRGRWLCLDFMDPPAPVIEAKAEIVESSISSNIQLISSSLSESIPADKIAHIYEISPGDAYPGSISVAVGSDQIQQPMYGIFLPINNGQYPLITGMHSKAIPRPIEKEVNVHETIKSITSSEQGSQQSQCVALNAQQPQNINASSLQQPQNVSSAVQNQSNVTSSLQQTQQKVSTSPQQSLNAANNLQQPQNLSPPVQPINTNLQQPIVATGVQQNTSNVQQNVSANMSQQNISVNTLQQPTVSSSMQIGSNIQQQEVTTALQTHVNTSMQQPQQNIGTSVQPTQNITSSLKQNINSSIQQQQNLSNVQPQQNISSNVEQNVSSSLHQNIGNIQLQENVGNMQSQTNTSNIQPQQNVSSMQLQQNVGMQPQQNVGIQPQQNVGVLPQQNVGVQPQQNVAVQPQQNVAVQPQQNVGVQPQQQNVSNNLQTQQNISNNIQLQHNVSNVHQQDGSCPQNIANMPQKTSVSVPLAQNVVESFQHTQNTTCNLQPPAIPQPQNASIKQSVIENQQLLNQPVQGAHSITFQQPIKSVQSTPGVQSSSLPQNAKKDLSTLQQSSSNDPVVPHSLNLAPTMAQSQPTRESQLPSQQGMPISLPLQSQTVTNIPSQNLSSVVSQTTPEISSTSQMPEIVQVSANQVASMQPQQVAVAQTSTVGTQASSESIPEISSTSSIVKQEIVVPSQVIQNHVEAKELGTPPSTNLQVSQEVVSEVPSSKSDINGEESESAPSGTSTVAIDNKIEQAMDLVKSHLMFAVREEVDVLKEKITELMDRISQLEYENGFLRANASQQTLEQLNQTQLLQQQQLNQPLTVSINSIPAVSQQPLQQTQLNVQNQPTS